MQGQVQNEATFKINILILIAVSFWSYVAGLLGSHSSALNFFFSFYLLAHVSMTDFEKNPTKQKSAKVEIPTTAAFLQLQPKIISY